MQQKALLLAAAVSSPADQPCPARLLLANEHLRYFVDWWIGGVVNKYVSQVTGMISDNHPFLPTSSTQPARCTQVRILVLHLIKCFFYHRIPPSHLNCAEGVHR